MLPIDHIFPALSEPKKIFITTHQKPDADALGSTLGLYHYLLQKGHTPTVVIPNELPDFLHWMPAIDTVLNYDSESKLCEQVLAESDLIFCLDFNHLSRIKGLEQPLRNATQPRILIDHHLQPEADVFYCGTSNPDKSSASEMVYDFILQCGDAELINDAIAQCLYTGAMTDTGSFRFPATTGSVHEMIAFFKNRGLEHSIIHQYVYDSWSANRMKFLGFALYEKMDIAASGKYGIIALSTKDMEPFHLTSGDTEGLVNYPLSIAGVQVAVLITEKSGEIKMSFRSKGNIDVSTFARTYFNGGGHFNAAGGKSDTGFEATVAKVKSLIDNIIP
ncbi:DHH family phosphoesterase [Taibaiella sp. KBW10]|uniref:DHH family phosphoesterase n=1 Tax=Taibaiella sp. KBW10 TaxID=2153357 RepID=UPI000F5B772C|nr:DHH family phosphoesterase [Taibaiella sp. KBW10]RQO32153.1 DHH family phosphoesterase [Taibaiella sp. KBW10]